MFKTPATLISRLIMKLKCVLMRDKNSRLTDNNEVIMRSRLLCNLVVENIGCCASESIYFQFLTKLAKLRNIINVSKLKSNLSNLAII